MSGDRVRALFTVGEVGKLFGLKEARLRYWAQTGFVGPSIRKGGRALYNFEDLVSVKVAKELLESGVPLQRVRKNLDALRRALPQVDRPLSRLKVCSDGDRIVVVGDDGAFEPATGQLVLSFAISDLTDQVAEVLALPERNCARPREKTIQGAYALFLEGLGALDGGDLRSAERKYRLAIAQDPDFAEVWTNLGNVLAARGARGDAREAYERAIALDPDQPEAHFNVANLLADLGEVELAIAEYRRVIAVAPEFADAHYNLALLCIRTGATDTAKSLMAKYIELDPDSRWAEKARSFLIDVSPETAPASLAPKLQDQVTTTP